MHFSIVLLRNLTRRPTRTFLTMIGISLAIAAMVSLRSVSQRFREATQEAFQRRNVDLVVMAEGVPDQLNSDLDEKIGEQILAMEGVEKVSGGMVELSDVKRGNGNINVMVQGWPNNEFDFPELKLLEGRWLQLHDEKQVMLGMNLAKNLKKKVGEFVKVMGENFEVIGVYQSFVVFENGSMVMPLHQLQQLSGRKGKVTGFSVVCQNGNSSIEHAKNIERVRKSIENLKPTGKGRTALSAMPTREYVDNALYLRMSNAVSWMISLIAIVIGTIGMLNTMMMSVLERVKEIGILRAVGWTKRRIIRMILGESICLSLGGAILGILLAFTTTFALSKLPMVSGFIDGELSMMVVIESLIVTFIMGLLGGLLPAFRASRLEPTEALRHE